MADSETARISKKSVTKASKRSKRSRRFGQTVGVEIGYRSIYIVELKWNSKGELVLEKCRTFDYDPNLSWDSAGFSTTLRKALKQFTGPSKELRVWTMPELDQARLHHIKVPKVNAARLVGAVYWALQREDAFVEEESVVDFEIEEESASAAILKVNGAIVKRSSVEAVQKSFSQAGFSLTGVGLPILALRNLVERKTNENPSAPVLICQIGKLTTGVSILLDGRLVFTRNVSIGLDSFAETLVKELDPIEDSKEASARVLNLGVGKMNPSPEELGEQQKIFSLIEPVLTRVVRQIGRTIEYFQSNFDTDPIETIYVGGEIAARGKIFDFLSEQLAPTVIAADPFDDSDLETNSSLPNDSADRVVYGTAFGLALEGSRAGINLAHTYKSRQNEGKQNKLATIASILLILLALAAALFYNMQRLKLRGLKEDKKELEDQRSLLGPQLTESLITTTSEEVRLLGERRRAAINRYEALALLSEITRLTPENVSLLHASAVMGSTITFLDPTVENRNRDSEKMAADEKGTLLLKGVVVGERTSLETSLTIYIARLDQSRLLKEIEVASTELVQSDGRLNLIFTLNIEAVSETEIMTIE